ncbi:hypothetical protein TCAL_16207 [Tigriopus californicus]|uniref:C3H1-type domain-containing protein n=2 Tax=Tigriopus californicus TaxID=6832 RepID=A0A553P2J7_TIGCA|nr:hypothetical protein TCAL_16207 [Tigriopus californicus]
MKAPSWLSKLITDLIDEEDLNVSPLAAYAAETGKTPRTPNLNIGLYQRQQFERISRELPNHSFFEDDQPLSFGPMTHRNMSTNSSSKSTSFETLPQHEGLFFHPIDESQQRPMNKINSSPTFSYQTPPTGSSFSQTNLENSSKFRSDTPDYPSSSDLIDERTLGGRAFSDMSTKSSTPSSLTSSISSSPVQMLTNHNQKSPRNNTSSRARNSSPDSRQSQSYHHISHGNKKTILCKYYMKGNCVHGVKCAFAHGEKELLVTPQDKENQRHSKVKTKPCKNLHETGYCQFGTKCLFLHSPSEVTRTKSPNQSQNVEKLYKTEPCRHFFKTGVCMFGDKCMFAHGQSERRDKLPVVGAASLKD